MNGYNGNWVDVLRKNTCFLIVKSCFLIDLVVASRIIKGAHNEEDDKLFKPRKWGTLCLAYVISMIWRDEGYCIHGVIQGYRCFTLDAFKRIAPLNFGLSIDIEMVMRSYRLKIKRTEFLVLENARSYGETFPTGLKLLGYLRCEYRRVNN